MRALRAAMLAKFIAGKLKDALKDFVEPNFKLAISGGTITLTNVTLKPGVIPSSVPFVLKVCGAASGFGADMRNRSRPLRHIS